MAIWRTLLAFGTLVLAFDLVWSYVARAGGYRYSRLAWVSLLIYGTAGFVAARGSGDVPAGAAVGLAVAGIEATLGWVLSIAIGPGRPDGPLTVLRVVATVVAVACAGAAVGAIGGVLARVSFLAAGSP